MKQKESIFNKRIPTILGGVILIAGLVVGILLVGKPQNLLTKAGPSSVPKEVKITDVGSEKLTISWMSDVPVTGMVKYSEDPGKLNMPAGDIRDQALGETGSYTTHYVELTNLLPGRTYYFEIVSGSVTYSDNEKPYQVRTIAAGNGGETGRDDIVSGKILSATGQGGIDGAIVYVEIDGGETLSALTSAGGNWRLNLAKTRNKDGQSLIYDKQNQQISIFVQGGIEGTAMALTNTANDTPVGDIIMGRNMNFIDVKPSDISGNDSNPLAEGVGFGGLADKVVDENLNLNEKIINPQTDGEKIATSSPEFRGKLPVGTSVQITVNSNQEQKTTVTVDENGDWKWTPPEQLEPGEHTITIEYWDDLGVLQRFVRSFTVLAAEDVGGLPSFSATPSATPTETLIVEPTIVEPTIVSTDSASTSSMPSTESGVPASGVLTQTSLLLIVGLGLFFGGQIFRKKWIQTI